METKTLVVNGIPRQVLVDSDTLLVDVLRNQLQITSVKVGCGQGQCGACSVILDGKVTRACIVKMRRVPDQAQITTLEGVGTPAKLHPLQESWMFHGAAQCGFCTPGFIVSAKALLDSNPAPSREEVRDWFQKHHNICRCTGYKPLVDAVMDAAAVMRGDKDVEELRYKLPADGRAFGSRLPRPSALVKVTGLAEYGADAVRAYILFLGPPEKEKLWNEDGLPGMYKFLNRLWRQVHDLCGKAGDETLFVQKPADEAAVGAAKKLIRERHRVVEKVSADIERNNFNTAIAAIMELSNAAGEYLRAFSPDDRAACEDHRALDAEVAEVLVKLVAPFTPHLADELWREALGREGFVYDQPWPEYDPDQARADEVELAVQICGKIKGRVTVAADAPEPEVLAAAREAVAAALEGKTVKKEVYVPGRLVNIVAV